MTIEDRTRGALHEVADGLLVTDGELDRLEEALMTLLERETTGHERRRSRTARTTAAVAAGVVALGIAGAALWWVSSDESAEPLPAGPPSAQTPSFDPSLVGLWRDALDGTYVWQFTDDGRVAWTDSARGFLSAEGAMEHLVSRSGEDYAITTGSGNEACLMRLRITPDGADRATATLVEETCADSEDPGLTLALERMSGRDPASPPLEPALPGRAESSPDSLLLVAGTWFEPESGTLLVIDSSMSRDEVAYLVDDDGDGMVDPDQRGQVSMADSGATVPVPDSGTSGGCAPVFSGVVTTGAIMTTTSGEGGCFPEGSTQTWLSVN